ncbi:MAG: Ig-like domain-containing protein [Prevotella sp.]|nr:Ig-like domain-containing protein [Prevotella sp.]
MNIPFVNRTFSSPLRIGTWGSMVLTLLLLVSCARMGNPDGGWYDETPPRVVSASPEDGGINVHSKHIYINFNEFVTIDNPTQNVVVSPPQIEAPEIKGQGKRISVELKDSLKPNTTYTIDFSSAISDNNEGNPLGNYTYSFSTGDRIDTLEVSGYVLQAENLEPVKGMLVGLYDNLSDTIFKKKPMLRVSKTDSRGHFIIKGVAPGHYRIYALQDADGDYVFGQKSEMLAFNHDIIEPSARPDVRQDTTWLDSLHIASINRVSYTHFLPDDICLRAFNEIVTDRYLVKSERKEANHFTLFYSYGDSLLPQITGLNFNADNAFVIDSSTKKDTITYWLRDTALVNQDTLDMVVSHHITDSLGILQLRADTLKLLSKQPYAKRLKEEQKTYETWLKGEEKKKKKGEPYDSIMPREALKLSISPSGEMSPDQNVTIVSPVPLHAVDTTHIHLYSKPSNDTLWYREAYEMHQVNDETYMLKAAWLPGTDYSLEIDSATFKSIYGAVTDPIKQGLKVRPTESYGTLLVTLNGMGGKSVIAQLLDNSDKVVKQVYSSSGQLEFYYLQEGKYFLRVIEDDNNNRAWDTGSYDNNRQPEAVYYYPEEIECKAKWDVTRTWDPTSTPLYRQKPSSITKQKADKEKQIQHRNLERAKKLGIEYISNVK